ncbi:SDR family oxidoreductase [Microbacterium terregens]|jgi:NAD(P)-dependent dehydrogenase (short-subunit alcohol dehydrogenase family)|uniref:SDR family NAD(P)-dependent oxidoreductase n=1 Tax=Microbacterium terregens TaxID=69363 RepID=A0ABV5T2Q5_9MICO
MTAIDLIDPLSDPLGGVGEQKMLGRRALVTGAGQNGDLPGVGYSIALLLASHGAGVAVLDRSAEAAQRTVDRIVADGGEAFAVVADATDDLACERAVAEAVQALGGLDTVVNNVASGDRAGIFDVTPERFEQLIQINLMSAWYVTRHVAPILPRGSSILNISSVGVSSRGPGMPYCVAKAGVENLTQGSATTLGPQGIRVNCIEVGGIWGSFAAANMDESMREPRRMATTLKTEGSAWDIAHAAFFLLSDAARWITGQILAVDGGPAAYYPPGPPITSVAKSGQAPA